MNQAISGNFNLSLRKWFFKSSKNVNSIYYNAHDSIKNNKFILKVADQSWHGDFSEKMNTYQTAGK